MLLTPWEVEHDLIVQETQQFLKKKQLRIYSVDKLLIVIKAHQQGC
jgi:hypothetical protein